MILKREIAESKKKKPDDGQPSNRCRHASNEGAGGSISGVKGLATGVTSWSGSSPATANSAS